MNKTLFACLLAGLSAQAASAELSSTLTLASDYLFNGISQTGEDPALQASLDATFDNGLYIGTWASNIDLGDDFDLEWDFYVGYRWDLGEDQALDLGILQYSYPGESQANYPEAYVAWHLPTGTRLQLNYSPDYFGDFGHHYFATVEQSWQLERGFGLVASITHSQALSGKGDNIWFGKDHYQNWRLGLTQSWAGFDMELSWQDTSIDDVPEAEGRLYFQVARTFNF
ncbi:TorF family putative porin [Gallaecimonas sp. GXIMD4217]|uniref:TorF family putative porin n=1 Tax=Gallaecimonas sp. GXIMD4217 TaxID=3131927 RepID=UPI00311AFEDA